MIPTNSRKILISAAVILAMFLALNDRPAQAGPLGAALGQAKKAETQANQQAKQITNFCNRLATLGNNLGQKITTQENKLTADRTNRLNQWEQKQSTDDTQITDWRKQQDANMTQNFSLLEKKAQTSAQKTAVKNFETAVTNAIQARRTAVDQARDTFRNAVKQLIAQRQTDVTSAMTTFQSAKEKAFSDAEASCSASNPDESSIRTTLKSDLSAARNQFTQTRQSMAKIGTQVSALAQTRQQAVKTADDTFKAAMQKAASDFKAAFPESGSSSTSTGTTSTSNSNS